MDCIKKHSSHFKSYIMISDSEISNENLKMVEIYILYCAYFSKKSLNEMQGENIFVDFAQDVCPRFLELFTEWTQRLSIFGKINPKQLNTIFKRLSSNLQNEHEEMENYCLLVEEIIDISPAYNADKSSRQKKSKKKKKEKEQPTLKNEEQEELNDAPSDSNYNKRIDGIVEENDFEYPLLNLKNVKKDSILSVELLEPGHYLTRKSSQQSQHDRRI
jgi:hypothetical protein